MSGLVGGPDNRLLKAPAVADLYIPVRAALPCPLVRRCATASTAAAMVSIRVALGAVAALCLIRFACLVVYRLFLSPLAKFPGSKLAAATGWYEFYFDWWLNGKYVFEIERMHRKYGSNYRV